MKFFVDTADTKEIKSLAASGLLDGVTTNPSLMAKSGRKFQDVLAEICATVPGPVSAEVASTEFDGMMAEARVLRAIAKNITVKVPLTPDGLRACRHLTDDGAMVNVTLVFRLRRRSWQPRPAPPSSVRSSAGWTTSARTAWR